MALGRAFERAIANATAFLSCLVIFVLAEEVNHDLTFSKIFSALEMFASIKFSLTIANIGVGLYFEIKVVFGRFASIFNIENKSMIQIDEEKQGTNILDSTNNVIGSS